MKFALVIVVFIVFVWAGWTLGTADRPQKSHRPSEMLLEHQKDPAFAREVAEEQRFRDERDAKLRAAATQPVGRSTRPAVP